MESQDSKTAVLLKIYFDLPFVLFLKDSLRDTALENWAKAYAEGTRPLPYARYAPASERPGFMTIGGGSPVFLPAEELAPLYEVRLPSMTVGIRTLRRVNPHRSTVMMGEVPGDRAGRASFSSVLVLFDYAELEPSLRDDAQYMAQVAVDAVNQHIAHYRVLADRPYVRSVTVSEIQEFQFITQYDDDSEHQMEFGSGSGPMHGFGGAVENEIDAALRVAIAREDPPAIEETLDADIRDHLDLHEWRLALIQTAVLFEAWLASFIRNRFSAKGADAVAIDAKFVNSSGVPKSATTLAAKVVKEATGFDFAATAEYTAWCTKVRDPRNDLVHGKRFSVSQNEAFEAYSSTIAAVNLLASK